MSENDFFIKLVEVLSGSPSLFASIAFGALLLKKYIINGSIKAFLDIKRQELLSLSSMEKSLVSISERQEKLFLELSKKVLS